MTDYMLNVTMAAATITTMQASVSVDSSQPSSKECLTTTVNCILLMIHLIEDFFMFLLQRM